MVCHNDIKCFSNKEVLYWNSVRNYKDNKFLLTGRKDSHNGVVFTGTINGTGKYTTVRKPHSKSTTVNDGEFNNCNLTLVGNYVGNNGEHGFIYNGKFDELNNSSNYEKLDIGSVITIPKGICGNQVVGNCNDHDKVGHDGLQLGPSSSFIYNISDKTYVLIDVPGYKSISLSGIVKNDNNSYTIVGSVSKLAVSIDHVKNNFPFGTVFVANYNPNTRKVCNFHEIELDGYDCHYTLPCGISKDCNGYQIGLNIVPIKYATEVKHVQNVWINLKEGPIGNLYIDVAIPFKGCPRILTGIDNKNFVGFRLKEARNNCEEDINRPFQGLFIEKVIECPCLCRRRAKPNYVNECWDVRNKNPYENFSSLWREPGRFTECGIIPVVGAGQEIMSGPVCRPDPSNPCIVPVDGPNVPGGCNFVNDPNAWGPHDLRWKRFKLCCKCHWEFSEHFKTWLWVNCGDISCDFNCTKVRDITEWDIQQCPLHRGDEGWNNYEGFAPAGSFPDGSKFNSDYIIAKLTAKGCYDDPFTLKFLSPRLPDRLQPGPCGSLPPALGGCY